MDDALQRQARFDTFVTRTEIPSALLALLIAPAIMLESHGQTPAIRAVALGVNWLVWLAFGAAYIVKIRLAPDRLRFVAGSWVDLLMIGLSSPLQVPIWLEGTALARVLAVLRFIRGATV